MARMMNNPQELKDVPMLFLVNFTIFDEIMNMESKSLYKPEGGLIIRDKMFLNLTDKYNNKRIIDFKTLFLQNDTNRPQTDTIDLNLALVIEDYGMLLCNITDYRKLILNSENFTCIEGENAFIHQAPGAISVHHEPLNPEQKVFLISA